MIKNQYPTEMLDFHHHHHSNPAPVGDHLPLKKKGGKLVNDSFFGMWKRLGFYDQNWQKLAQKPQLPGARVGVFKGRLQRLAR